MVPQTTALNRGIREGVESAVRRLAGRGGQPYVVTGPAYAGGPPQAISQDGVLVPTSCLGGRP